MGWRCEIGESGGRCEGWGGEVSGGGGRDDRRGKGFLGRRGTLKTEQRTSGELQSEASSTTSFFRKSVMTVGGMTSQHLARILHTPRVAVERTMGWGSSSRHCRHTHTHV